MGQDLLPSIVTHSRRSGLRFKQVTVVSARLQFVWWVVFSGLLAANQFLTGAGWEWLIYPGIVVLGVIFIATFPISLVCALAIDQLLTLYTPAGLIAIIGFAAGWGWIGAVVFGGDQPLVGAAVVGSGALGYALGVVLLRARLP